MCLTLENISPASRGELLISSNLVLEKVKVYTTPKYSGIAIGVGVCVLLLLLSAASVCLLNLKNNGGIWHFSVLQAIGMRKREEEAFTRLPSISERPRVRKMLPVPLERINSQNNTQG